MGFGNFGGLHIRIPFRVPVALLLTPPFSLRLIQISRLGLLDILRVHSVNLRHVVLFFHTGALVVFRCKYLCLGAICLAHGQRDMCPYDYSLGIVRLLRGCR